MNNHLNQNKHKLHALFVKNTFISFEDPINETNAFGDIDKELFFETVIKELNELQFSNVKHSKALLVDQLRLYTELSWPSEPDVEVRLFLYENPDATFFLEVIR